MRTWATTSKLPLANRSQTYPDSAFGWAESETVGTVESSYPKGFGPPGPEASGARLPLALLPRWRVRPALMSPQTWAGRPEESAQCPPAVPGSEQRRPTTLWSSSEFESNTGGCAGEGDPIRFGSRGGWVMLEVSFTAESLAQTRFVVSPLTQAAAMLHPQRTAPRALRERRLPLLTALRDDVRSIEDYAPGILHTPPAPPGLGDIDAELHDVATAPTTWVAQHLNRLVGARGGEEASALAPHLQLGERLFAQRIAEEIEVLWKNEIAPAWTSIRSRIEGDIENRAHVIAREGLGVSLSSLHPTVSYRGDKLRLADPPDPLSGASFDGPITFHPSPLVDRWLISVDPGKGRVIYLVYPLRSLPRRSETRYPDALAKVIGHSRLTLLADLQAPRTTTELADRHWLSTSTISYHLGQLFRGGLIRRVRSGNKVYYQQTPVGGRLIEQGGKGDQERC